MNFFNNFSKQHLSIAHRGYRSIRAENTLSAFEASLGKFDLIELDIQVTKDYKLVVFHDYTLERTTNINKNKEFLFNGSYYIYDYTLEQLKILDIGSWFIKDDPFETIKDGIVSKKELKKLPIQTILTLNEILEFGQKNNIALNIELKDCSYIDDTRFVTTVLDTIKELNITIPLLISSFNYNYLKLIKDIDPNISTALNVEERYPDNLLNYLDSLKVDSCHICSNIITPDIVKKLNNSNYFVNIFTINDKKEKKRLFNMGVKAVFSDI